MIQSMYVLRYGKPGIYFELLELFSTFNDLANREYKDFPSSGYVLILHIELCSVYPWEQTQPPLLPWDANFLQNFYFYMK